VIIHTTIGASIHSFAGYHLHKTPDSSDSPIEGQDPTGGDGVPVGEDGEGALLSRVSAIVGILLCVAIFIYISWVARKAVDEELEDDELPAHNPEETELFLDPTDNAERGMGEVSFSRPLVPVSSRSSFSDDTQLRPPVPRTSVSLDDPWRRREEQSSTPLRAF
jgi:preprotein translocase subunit SecG